MKRIKQVNLVFMFSTLMPYTIPYLIAFAGIQITDPLIEILFSVLIYATPAIIYLIVTRQNLKDALRIRKIKISNVFLLMIFTALISPVMTLVNAISLLFSNNMIQGTVSGITERYPLIVGVLAVGLMPAIFEESVYRGVLYNEYRKANPRAAIFFSALLFGLLHMNLNQFSYAFCMGIIFALVIEATDSIISTMILHFLINSTSVVITYFLPKAYRLLEQLYGSDKFNAEEMIKQAMDTSDKVALVAQIEDLILPAIVAAVLAFLVYRVIAKNEDRYEAVKDIFRVNHGHERMRSMLSIPLAIGIAVCIFTIVANLML